jgi:tetratricopeptide (TPR) repeat protein
MAHKEGMSGTAAAPAPRADGGTGATAAAGAAGDAPTYGTVTFPVSCNAAAQEQFNQAVGALHSFFYPETIKAFTRVLEIDPQCAMAYWGIARSQPPNPLVSPFPPSTFERGREAVAKGKALGPKTQRERDWLDAAEAYFAGPDDVPYPVRAKRYERAMEQLWQRYPDDTEAAAFCALALLESADPRDLAYGNQFKAAKILEKFRPSHPNHPGITHYIIHAYDYSPIAGQGLAAANQYAKIAPSAPHALHMPSHIYSMLGMWKPSIESNQATLVVARAYAAKNFPAGTATVAEAHSLDFMEYAYLQLGMDNEAREVADTAMAIAKLNVTYLAGETGLAAPPVRFALERGAWAEAATLEPRQSTFPYVEAMGYFGRALGAAKLGDPAHVAQARLDIEKMAALRAKYDAKPDQGYWSEQTQLLIDGASAWLAHAQKDDIEAVRLLRKAADLTDASLKHVAMENPLFPMREQLGYLLLDLREPEKALAEFEASVKSSPNRLRGLYGAAKAAELGGHSGVARDYYEKLRALTAGANGQRAEVVEMRAFLASVQ